MTGLVDETPKFEFVVVEDDEDIAEALTEIIQSQYSDRVNVKFFLNPEEAIDYGSKNKIDLLISDQVMPKMQGDVLISKIRTFNPGGFYLLCTGKADLHLAFTSRQEGVHGLVEKPVSPEKLIKAIHPFVTILDSWNESIKNQVNKAI